MRHRATFGLAGNSRNDFCRKRRMTIKLRPESPQDEPFIRRVLLETIAAELGASEWPEPMRSHLLGIQYTGRRHAEAAGKVIEADGVDAGWVLVNTTPDEMRLVEIMIVPELRGRGIGTATLGEILSTSAALEKPVRLNVNKMNHGAIRLYERMGFRKIGGDEVQYLMEACEIPHERG
jgi:ribosomal protein S18 acetylase RimI-like enzyme